MSESNENKKCSDCECGPGMAFLVLRLWLGVRAILAGIEKFGAYASIQKPMIDPTTGQPDASGVMVNVNVKFYSLTNYSGIPPSLKDRFTNEPLLPKFALTTFDHLLGPALILTWQACWPNWPGAVFCRPSPAGTPRRPPPTPAR